MKLFEGKAVLITGAGGGIGLAAASAFGQAGASVTLRPTAFVPPASQTEHYCFLWNGERIHQLFLLPAETKVIVPEDPMRSVSAA